MDFLSVCKDVLKALDDAGVRFALIGGFAMGLRGVSRTTTDIDLLLVLEDADVARAVFSTFGYRPFHESDNVLQFAAGDQYGSIDVILSFREVSLAMLARAERVTVAEHVTVPVLQPEDIIGLKIQAMHNDERRADQDWADIKALVAAATAEARAIDWSLIEDYFRLFERQELFEQLKQDFA